MPPARPFIELRLGEPRWYPAAGGALALGVFAALIITPLYWPYAAAVIGAALAVVLIDRRQRQARERYRILRVYPELHASLIDEEGRELPARIDNACWISRPLIVVPLKPAGGGRSMRVIVARDRNDPDAFRRLAVLCRHGHGPFAEKAADRHN